MDITILREVGLTETEAKIYLMLLEEGRALAGKISKNTGVHRRSVYDAIERLIEKGLVQYIKENNRKYFSATDPEKLLDIVHERAENIKKVMPELKLLQNFAHNDKETLFYRGKEGIKSIFLDQIREGKEVLVLANSLDVGEIIKYYFMHFDKKRVEKKIGVKMLFGENARKNTRLQEIPLAEMRFMPQEYSSAMSVYIYGNNVSIVQWLTDEPIAILIREPGIADGFKSYFGFMWNMSKA